MSTTSYPYCTKSPSVLTVKSLKLPLPFRLPNEPLSESKPVLIVNLQVPRQGEKRERNLRMDETEEVVIGDADDEGGWLSDSSETFGTRQLCAAERDREDDFSVEDGFQILGEAVPGKVLRLACQPFVLEATVHFNFQWVRYSDTGCELPIQGANKFQYLVTADDLDFFLAVNVQPLDAGGKKVQGKNVRFVANNDRKITCDPNMAGQIERSFYTGNESFEVLFMDCNLYSWKRAELVLKKEGYSILCHGPGGLRKFEKFSPGTIVTVPICDPDANEFVINSPSGQQYLLKAEDNKFSRDAIVLLMRLFITRTVGKREVKRRWRIRSFFLKIFNL